MPDDAPTVAARPRRRAVRVGVRVVVFALIGAVLTVCVAWCPFRQWAIPGESDFPADDAGTVWSKYAPTHWPPMALGLRYRWRSWIMTADHVHVIGSDRRQHYVMRVRTGWPLRVVEGGLWRVVEPDDVRRTTGRVDLWQVIHDQGRRPTTVIPLRPLWQAFLANTAFFASLAWVLWVAPGTTRRAIRRRRGRCPACAYPVGEAAVCSECGGAVRPAS